MLPLGTHSTDAEIVSMMTGVPLKRLEKEEAQRLLELEQELHKRVISQDEAIQAVARAVRARLRWAASLSNGQARAW